MPAVLKPGLPFPTTPYKNTSLRYTPLYSLLQKLNPGDQVTYFDQNGLQQYKATVTSVSATSLVLNVPGLANPTVTFILSPQDLEACVSVMALS